MKILRKLFKIGVPSGVVYYSVKEDLWAPSDEKKISRQRQVMNEYKAELGSYVGPYVKPYVNVNQLDLKSLWNKGVKTTFSTIANLDVKKLSEKVVQMTSTSDKK